ncbi:MAG: hypothetical protein Tsb002_03610 [Wenzhouxiangellaceae bacterium]
MKLTYKSIFTGSLALALSCSAHLSFAGDIEGATIQSLKHYDGTINGQTLDISGLADLVDAKLQAETDKEDNRAPAQGITYFEVYAVGSSNIGWELNIPAIQQTTTYDHGGALMRVVVLQVGLGNPNNASMGGMTTGRYLTENLCGADLHWCSPGETITGFLYYYAFDGLQNGFFTNSSNSVATPFGFWSDSISVR